VKNEEIDKPKMMALPSACQSSLDSVIGMIPAMVQKEVMRIASSHDLTTPKVGL